MTGTRVAPAVLRGAAVLVVAAGATAALAAEGVAVVIGSPREGPAAAAARALADAGLRVEELDSLPPLPDPRVALLLLGRPPRTSVERNAWVGVANRLVTAGVPVLAAPAAAEVLPPATAGPLLAPALPLPDDPAGAAALAAGAAGLRPALVHPAAGEGAGVARPLLLLPLPRDPPPVAPRTLAFLGVVAAVTVAAALAAARGRGGRGALVAAATGLLGAAMAFLPGVAPPPLRETRLRAVERASPAAVEGRVLEVVEVEALRGTDLPVRLALDPHLAWGEALFEPGGGTGVVFEGDAATGVLPAAGTRLVVVGAGGRALPPAPEAYAWSLVVAEGLAIDDPPGTAPGAAVPGGAPRSLADALADLRRSPEPAEGAAGALLEGLLRPPSNLVLRVGGPGAAGAVVEVVRLR